MLIEMRTYTMKAGNVPAFWEAQSMRGFDPVSRPIMARLMGYFTDLPGGGDRVIHLWRFDSYDDWITRLHGPDASREKYFQVVRPLMLAQESRFMLPAPVEGLTPFWGNGQDWLPGDPPPLRGEATGWVEITTTQLLPGTLGAYWQACRSAEGACLTDGPGRLLGSFYTLVGQQHQVTTLRHCAGPVAIDQAGDDEAARDRAAAFDALIRPMVAGRTREFFKPSPVREMSPLYF